MRILTLVWSIGQGGTERAAVNYAIGYKKFGHESRVLVLGEGHHRYQQLLDESVDTILLCLEAVKKAQVLSSLAEWNPHIIHIHNFQENLLPYLNALKGADTRIVETNVFSRPSASKAYSMVDLSLQLTCWGYWKYCKWAGALKHVPQVAVMPYIVDTAKFLPVNKSDRNRFLQQLNIPVDAFVIGRLGQSHISKWSTGYVDVIKNTVSAQNNIYYILVGVPERIKKMIEDQGGLLNQRVKIIDNINGDSSLALYYHSLDCFAHISQIGESFGYVLTEALHCKIPVVTLLTPFKDNGQFEIVGHRYGGICTTTLGEFIEAIRLLHQNKKQRDIIKSNLNNWVEARFSFEVVMPKLIGILENLLERKSLEKDKCSNRLNEVMTLYGWRAFYTRMVASVINSKYAFRAAAILKR